MDSPNAPTHSRTHRKSLIWLVLYFILVGVVMSVCKRNDKGSSDNLLRVDSLHHFERLSKPSCDELASTALMLFIEGMDTGLRSAGCLDAKDKISTAAFDFKHTRPAGLTDAKNQAVWTAILGRPLQTLEGPRPLRYEIRRPDSKGGTENIAPEGAQVALVIFEWWAAGVVALVLLVWGLMIYLGACSALLRDSAAAGTLLPQRTFSLAKVQMAWWFAIVFATFIFLWLVTGETPSISGQALTLLGISSATAAASMGVSGERTSDEGVTGVFVRDLLSDSGGITIHRFQMLVMTVTLGLVFLFHVARHLTMPEFDPSLLTLMGISAATYVGLKIPEKKTDADTPLADTVAEAKVGYSPTPQ